MNDNKLRLTEVIDKYSTMKYKFMTDRLEKLGLESANMITQGFDILIEGYKYWTAKLKMFAGDYSNLMAACIRDLSLSRSAIEFMPMIELHRSLDHIDRVIKRHIVGLLTYEREKLEIESFSNINNAMGDSIARCNKDIDRKMIDGVIVDLKDIEGHYGRKLRATKKKPSKQAILVLMQWLYRHRDNPYPSKAEKSFLSRLTRLTAKQVDVWFVNYRMRHTKPSQVTH